MADERKGEPEHAVEDVPGLDELADALLVLRNRDEARRFLRDLCTLGELEALAHRWQIARLVDSGRSYLDVADTVHTSTATVTRVAHWLRHGAGGYTLALERTARRQG
jgi:TrpR-related protein YerC/YecD